MVGKRGGGVRRRRGWVGPLNEWTKVWAGRMLRGGWRWVGCLGVCGLAGGRVGEGLGLGERRGDRKRKRRRRGKSVWLKNV